MLQNIHLFSLWPCSQCTVQFFFSVRPSVTQEPFVASAVLAPDHKTKTLRCNLHIYPLSVPDPNLCKPAVPNYTSLPSRCSYLQSFLSLFPSSPAKKPPNQQQQLTFSMQAKWTSPSPIFFPASLQKEKYQNKTSCSNSTSPHFEHGPMLFQLIGL